MNATFKNENLTKRQKIIRKKNSKLKEEIQKLYPGAYVKATCDCSKFWIVDAFGDRIFRNENRVDSNSVFGAWKQAALMLHCFKEIQRNNYKFNDEAVIKSLIKKLKAGEGKF